MAQPKQKIVTLQLTEIVSDRLQYKPYTAHLTSPEGKVILVDVPIDPDDVIDSSETHGIENKGYIRISVDGLAAVMGTIADSIENMHDNYKKKIMKGK